MSILGKFTVPEPHVDKETQNNIGRGPKWKCVRDTSSGKVFLGNLFRKIDLTEGGFPIGTVFENVKTGKRITQ